MNETKKNRCCYVTVLSSISYLEGIRSLIYSLNKVKSAYPLVVLLPVGFDSASQLAIKAWGGIIEYAQNVDLGELAEKNPRAYWNDTFFKLNVFNMTQYEKIVFLDSDLIVLKNIDHLFEMEHFTAVQGGKLIYHWEDVSSGLMVIKPDNREFNEIVKYIPTVGETLIGRGQGFGDQDVISYYYKNINKVWEGEKRIDERYYGNIRCIHELCVHYGYKNMIVIHFAGAKKPWMFTFWEKIKYVVSYTLHHERYRAKCALKYFVYVALAKRKLRKKG